MIKCPNCGSDNQLGVVHCTGCGKILEINDLRPEMEIKEKSNDLASYVIKRTLLLIILLALAVGTAGIFWPGVIEKTDLKAKSSTSTVLKSLSHHKSSRKFMAEEVQLYLNTVISQNAEKPDYFSYTPQAVNISFDKDGFQLILRSGLLDNNLTIYTTLKGTIEVGENGIELKTTHGKLGKTPFPALIGTYLLTSFKNTLAKNDAIKGLTPAISKVKFGKGKVTIYTAPKRR